MSEVDAGEDLIGCGGLCKGEDAMMRMLVDVVRGGRVGLFGVRPNSGFWAFAVRSLSCENSVSIQAAK